MAKKISSWKSIMARDYPVENARRPTDIVGQYSRKDLRDQIKLVISIDYKANFSFLYSIEEENISIQIAPSSRCSRP